MAEQVRQQSYEMMNAVYWESSSNPRLKFKDVFEMEELQGSIEVFISLMD